MHNLVATTTWCTEFVHPWTDFDFCPGIWVSKVSRATRIVSQDSRFAYEDVNLVFVKHERASLSVDQNA